MHLGVRQATAWLRTHHASLLALLQTAIAMLMLSTLCQNRETLRQNSEALQISQRQLESTVVPCLEVYNAAPTLALANTGSVDIADIEVIMTYCHYDCVIDGGPMTSTQMTTPRVPIASTLAPGASVRYALADSLCLPDGMVQELHITNEKYCMVIRYRRAVDRHSYYKAVTFWRGQPSDPDATIPFVYTPLRVVPGMGGQSNYLSTIRDAVERPCLDALGLAAFDP